MEWYASGRWDVDAIRALFARARTRRYHGRSYDALPLDHWALRPPASGSAVASFESALGVELPDGYRNFLLQVGDGAPGPGEGVWPLAGRETGGPAGHGVEHPTDQFDLDGPVAQVIPGNDDPDSDEYWDDATYRQLTGVLDIGCLGYPADVFLVLTGPRRGEVWSVDEDCYFPLLADDVGEGAEHHDFVSWYSQWLDELFTDPQQVVDAPTDATSTLTTVGRLVQDRPTDARDRLEALIDGGVPAVAACGLRALGLVDPVAGRRRADLLLDHRDPPVAEAAFDVFVALADQDDLPRLGQLVRAAGPLGPIPMDNPERVHLEQVLHRLGDPGEELRLQVWLHEQLGRETTVEDRRQFRAQLVEWQRSGAAGPPQGSLPHLAGLGPPSASEAAADLREAVALLQEGLGENVDWSAVAEMQASLISALEGQVPDEVRASIAETYAALRPPTGPVPQSGQENG